MESLIVGDKDCQFCEVVDTLMKTASITCVWKKRQSLASRLGLSGLDITNLLRSHKTEHYGFFMEAFAKYRCKKSTKATLKDLVQVLESMELQDAADTLKKKFFSESKLKLDAKKEKINELSLRNTSKNVEEHCNNNQIPDVNSNDQMELINNNRLQNDEIDTKQFSLESEVYQKTIDHKYIPDFKMFSDNEITNSDIDNYKTKCTQTDWSLNDDLLNVPSVLEVSDKHTEPINQLAFKGYIPVDNSIEPVLGIDLGTEHFCVAVFWENEINFLQNSFSSKTIPSYVKFEQDLSTVVGDMAKKHSYLYPKNTVYESKRMLGRTLRDQQLSSCHDLSSFTVVYNQNKTKIIIGDKSYDPEDICSILLKECRKLAKNHFKCNIRKTVITVPACFNEDQRSSMIKAAEIAKLDVLEVLTDPIAAALSFKMQENHKNSKTVLLLKIGGGTVDAALVELSGTVKTIAVSGDATLGGKDFDTMLVNYCLSEFQKIEKIDIFDETLNTNIKRGIARLKLECEERRKDLIKALFTNVTVDCFVSNIDLKIAIGRDAFELLCDQYFKRILHLIDKVLNEAKMQKSEIKEIVLFGGYTRIPGLENKIINYFENKRLNFSINPDEAIASGAAFYGAMIGGIASKSFSGISIVDDIILMPIGVEVIVKGIPGRFVQIIPRNTIYPTKHSVDFETSFDDQCSPIIRVYQGNAKVAAENLLLEEIILGGIRKAKAGQECISVDMEVCRPGVLSVTVTSSKSGILVVKTVHLK